MNAATAPPPTDFSVRVAATATERGIAYRLRYEFFTRELKDERYANHGTEQYFDSWDHDGSPVVVAWTPENQPIGTLRLAMRRLGSYLGDDLYQWGELARVVQIDEPSLLSAVGIISRGGVVKPFRRTRVMSCMLDELERIARSEGIVVLLGAVEVDNFGSKRWIESNGFRLYCISRSTDGFQGDFYYKDLRTPLVQDNKQAELCAAPDPAAYRFLGLHSSLVRAGQFGRSSRTIHCHRRRE